MDHISCFFENMCGLLSKMLSSPFFQTSKNSPEAPKQSQVCYMLGHLYVTTNLEFGLLKDDDDA